MVFVPRVNILQWFLFLIESQRWMKEKLPMDLVEWKPKQKHDEENGWKIVRSKHFAMTKMRAPGMNGANAIEYNDESNVSFFLFFFSIYPHLILSFGIFCLFVAIIRNRNATCPIGIARLGSLLPFTLIFQIARKITFFSVVPTLFVSLQLRFIIPCWFCRDCFNVSSFE